MIKSPSHNMLGVALVETLITVVIIAIGVVSLIRFQSYLAYDQSLNNERGDAVVLAASEIENLRDFQVLYTTPGYTAYQDIVSGNSTSTVNATIYNIVWTVTPHTNPDYKSISVTVSWTDRRGSSQSVTLDSIIAGIEPAFSAMIM